LMNSDPLTEFTASTLDPSGIQVQHVTQRSTLSTFAFVGETSTLRRRLPLLKSQNLSVPSMLPVTICLPSGESANDNTPAVCPVRERVGAAAGGVGAAASASVKFHSLSVLSSLPESAVRPSGENATELTEFEWPVKVCSSSPVATPHSMSVPSPPPDSAARPFGENATELI